MPGIIMLVNTDETTTYVGYSPENTIDDAQDQLVEEGGAEHGTRIVSFIPFDESDPLVRAFAALTEVSWKASRKNAEMPPIDNLLTKIFDAGREFGNK